MNDNEYSARKHTYESRNLLCVGTDYLFDEGTGEVHPRNVLSRHLLTLAHSLSDLPVIVCNDAASIVYDLVQAYKYLDSFHWRATPLRRVKRSAAKPPESKPAVSVHLNPLYCGFRRQNGHTRNRYFWFIDCAAITGNTSGYHYSNLSETESLATFGRAYREFCRNNGIALSGQRGKVGSAMLRDSRFMPSSTRRIPTFINEQTRQYLPGNHYELRTETNKTLRATYLDITSAHHEAAKKTNFPDPNGLRARGAAASKRWADSPLQVIDPLQEPWAKRGTAKFDAVLRSYGLVALRALYRGTPKDSINHPATWKATPNGPTLIFAYTNEIELLRSSGFQIEGIEAAWTSGRTDRTLNKYAEHAIQTLQATPVEHRQWTKSLLLSTYGMLAKNPSRYQSVSNLEGESFTWPTPNGWIQGQMKQTQRKHSSPITNVIALGMIQAETRRNVIETARYLESFGVITLALYADSLIVAGTLQDSPKSKVRRGVYHGVGSLPFLPPEWRVKTELTGLRFLNQVSWLSDQEERLPGISREDVLRESRRSAIRARARQRGFEGDLEWLLDQAEIRGTSTRRLPTNV